MTIEEEYCIGDLNQDDTILIVAGLEELLKRANSYYKNAIYSLLRKIFDGSRMGFEKIFDGRIIRSILTEQDDLNELIILMTVQTAIKSSRGLKITFGNGGNQDRCLEILRPALRFSQQWLVIGEDRLRKYYIPVKDVKQALLL